MDFDKIKQVTSASIPKVRLLYYFNVVASIAYIISFGLNMVDGVVIAFMFFVMNCLGITVTYHRYWSHHSFEFKKEWIKKLFTLFATLSGSGSAIGWSNIHRRHHKFSDKDGDPHKAAFGLHKIMLMDYKLEKGHKYIVDLVRHNFLMSTHNYYFIIVFAYALALLVLFNVHGLMLGFVIPAALTMGAEHFTNFINHYKNKTFSAANQWFMLPFNFGDGWHKNHHDNPLSYTTSTKWWEFDPTGWVIKLVGKDLKEGIRV